jgi:hypothetical protein
VTLRNSYPILVILLLLALPASAFAAPPSNDTRANAQRLDLGQRVNGTTAEATSDEDDASGCGPSDTPSVWYRVDATRDGRAIVQLQASGNLDVTVDVYERVRSEFNSLSCDNSDRNGRASTEFQMRKGRSYLVRVSERERSESGDFTLLVDIGQPPASPPGRPLPRRGASGTVQRVFEPSNAYSAKLREGHTYRINLAPESCMSLSIYGPGASSFEDESPRRVLRCGGYTLFTPGPHETGRYSFLIQPNSSARTPQHYRLQVARAGVDDTAPGRFIRNYQRVGGVLNANRIDVVDVYRFDVLQRSITDLSLSVPSGAEFAMVLVSPNGHRIRFGGTDEDIHVRTPVGRYFVFLKAHRGAAGRYRLKRASKTITGTSLTPSPHTSNPGGIVNLRVGVTPAASGPVTVLIERFDPVSGWRFARRFERHLRGGSVTIAYKPPAVGGYRAVATFNGTRIASGSHSRVRHFRVAEPLHD